MDSAEKAAVIEEYRRNESDSGSPEVQIAVLSKRISNLTQHLSQFPRDYHSRRGLYRCVQARRKHMRYLRRHKPDVYRELIARLGIRG